MPISLSSNIPPVGKILDYKLHVRTFKLKAADAEQSCDIPRFGELIVETNSLSYEPSV
jgi:hypothetical protein